MLVLVSRPDYDLRHAILWLAAEISLTHDVLLNPRVIPPQVPAFEDLHLPSKVLELAGPALLEMGIPLFWGGIATAPFDGIADMLRGTQGIVFDMFRQPDKLLHAIKAITPVTIDVAVRASEASGSPLIFIPLHKGADGWMSEKQFLKFYWPTLKELCIGLINEGCVPLLFAEGGYNSRLEVIKDLPKGAVVWWFDQTDIFRAKEILGDTACICGNVPSSILLKGTPATVKDHCRKLIEVVGQNGGYILTSGAIMNQAKPENIRAMMEAAKEYGVY